MRRSSGRARNLRPAKWGLGVSVHGSNPEPQTLRGVRPMSALPPKADIAGFQPLKGALCYLTQPLRRFQRNTFDCDAMHQPAFALVIVQCIVPCGTVVPERDGTFFPSETSLEFWSRGVCI